MIIDVEFVFTFKEAFNNLKNYILGLLPDNLSVIIMLLLSAYVVVKGIDILSNNNNIKSNRI